MNTGVQKKRKKNQKENPQRQKGILQYVNFKNKKFKCFSTANQLKFILHYKYFSQKFLPWGSDNSKF